MKPRFKLRLDGSLVVIQDSLSCALRIVLAQDDGPMNSCKSLRCGQKISMRPEDRIRRQIVRAYGTLSAFAWHAGLKSFHVTCALDPRGTFKYPDGVVQRLKRRMGLPVRLRESEASQ